MTIKLTRLDLDYILTQIQMAEAGQPPVNPLLAFGLREVAGTNNNGVPGQTTFGSSGQVFPTITDPLFQTAQAGGPPGTPLTSYAQTLAGNVVVDAQPRLISQLIASQTTANPAAIAAQTAQMSQLGDGYLNTSTPGADGLFGGTYTITGSGLDTIYGTDDDTAISFGADGKLGGVDDVTSTRGALHLTSAGVDGKLNTADDLLSDDVLSGNLATPTDKSSSGSTIPGLAQSLFIPNITPDNGLSAPANSFFTFFGQFFDHGLDKITTGGNGIVYIPLMPDDPLYVVGGHSNFMILTRATDQPGPDGILGTADDVHAHINQTSPFVDQSQTYASDPSHQVFLREYIIGADAKLHSSGALLGHDAAGKDGVLGTADDRYSMATWGDLKFNARTFLGIDITDADVGNVPLLATDPYGNFLPGANGLAQLVVRFNDGSQGLVEGNLGAPIATDTAAYHAVRTGNAFINDMAHSASPTDDFGNVLAPDANPTADPNLTPAAGFYDNELLNAHYVAGDGRVNENVGLTAVQDLFHSEHDRLLAQIKTTIQAGLDTGDVGFATDWVLPGVNISGPELMPDGTIRPTHLIADNEWNGERLFQAAKFGTETEYQHIVFDEFARYVAPSIHVAGATNVHIDPAITSEFANVVYRFGHSMLDENINIYVLGADGKPVIDPVTGQPQMTQEGLIQAFTNPTLFAKNVGGDFGNSANSTADIVLGTVNQISASIDEFVTGSLQNNLLGLPLDLGALNIARGRDTGVAPLNLVRNQLYSQTGDSQLKPYTSWADFGSQIKHPESLVNFIAAYGTEPTITAAMTMIAKRAAAQTLVNNGTLGSATFDINAYNFLNSVGQYASPPPGVLRDADLRTIHDSTGAEATWSTGSITGLDNVDLWIGGLAEKISLFGGVLGSTFEYVFRTQMEALQDADRLYYLPRIEGTDYEESLQDSSLAQLIRANTDIKHLPGNMFLTPEYTIEASDYFATTGVDASGNPIYARDASGNMTAKDPGNAHNTWLHNPVTGQLLVQVTADGTLQFIGDDNFLGNTIVLGGTEGDDKLTAGAADDDTIWGDGGNDIIDGGGGNDFLFGGKGDDTIYGGQGDDTIHGDEGNDTIYGGDGADTIFGGDGNDYIDAGRGADVVLGGLGNDIIIGNEGQDELTGGEGDDWIESRGGQGHLMFGDSGAPTGGQALYSANDVMIGGAAGGDIMKGFSGDDIMVGGGSFSKFLGMLGFDWGSYEVAVHGVDADMNRKEFIAPNGSEDAIRDIWQHTEGVSGSSYDDLLKGTNDTRLLATKDELDNVNLIAGLQSFFAPGIVSFDGGNIMLGGAGNDTIIGGGGSDIIDGDAFLHVALTSYTAGAQIIRQINYDPNGNTAVLLDGFGAPDLTAVNANGFHIPTLLGGHVNAANVDTAVYNDVFADYDIGGVGGFFGPDAQGFIHVDHTRAGAAIVGGNPQGLLGGDDGNDRVRNIERLQFTDITVSIDSNGHFLTSSDGRFLDPVAVANPLGGDPYYDAVPVGTPTLTASGGFDPTTTTQVGQTLTANFNGIPGTPGVTDADGIVSAISYQWQENDVLRGEWVPIAGATSATYVVPSFFEGALGLRVKATYVDGKGYTETVYSASTSAVTFPGDVNTAPRFAFATQFNGISNTTALAGQSFDYFSPFSDAAGVGIIYIDAQEPTNALDFKATLEDGSDLSTIGMGFSFDAATGAGHFFTLPAGPGPDNILGNADDITGTLDSPGQIGIRVTVTDHGVAGSPPLSLVDNFIINVLPIDQAPVANNDSYSILEDATLAVTPASQGVLANDTDPDPADRLTAQLVTGPAHGALQFNKDGTFIYTPTLDFTGSDSFTYVADDIFLTPSVAPATVTISVVPKLHVVTASLKNDTGASATDGVTNDATLSGKGFVGAAVFAAVDGAAPVRFATADATGAWSGAPVLTDGFHTIVISETSGLDGRTDFATVSFTLDTTPPPTTVSLVQDTGASGTDGITSNPALSGIGDANSSVLVSIDGAAGLSVATDLTTGLWTYTPVVADGIHTVNVTGNTDIAGNTGHASLTFAVDRVAPAVTEALSKDSGASATDKVTNNDTIIGSGDPNGAVFASFDGAAAVQIATGDATTGAWTFTPVLADGNHTVVVSETDLAGNTGSTSLAFRLDTTLPPVTVALVSDTGPSATDGITKVATVTGTGDPNSSVQVTIDGVLAGSIATNAAGVWGYTPFNPAQGLHNVSVTGTDLAGNTQTATLAYTLDNVAPVTPTIAGITYNATATALTNYKLSGTAEAGSTVVLSNGATTLGTATAAANGAWTFTVTPNPSSGFSSNLTVTSTDLAGNVSGGQSVGVVVGTAAVNALTGFAGVPNLILGLGGNDTLNGSSANNILDGGTGSDTMTGLAGNDTYFVDNVGDAVIEALNQGTDTINTTLTTYSVATLGNVENLTFIGTVGNFTGTGNTLANVITGGGGADTLTGGTNTAGNGVDTLIGLAGNDTYNVSNVGDVIVEAAGGGTDTVRTTLASYTLGTNLENLTYTGAGGFAGTGNSVANIITGGAGADTLDGGANAAGVDTLVGGTGNDTYIINSATDVVTEATGAGTDTERTALASLTLAANVENLTYTGASNFAGTGNSLANVITGGAGNDTLTGGTNVNGVDTLIGGAGNDTYVVSNTGDVVTEATGGGTDTVRTGLATFTLAANVENLTYTGASNFAGIGNTLANVITGGAGADTLTDGTNTAGNGVDTLIGGAGADTYNVSNVGDIVTEATGGGTDTVRTTLSSYTLDANVENLTFTGAAGNFAGTGNTLVNTITGGTGADTLDGGKNTTGVDTLVGGAGNDTYIVRNAGDVTTENNGAGTDTVQAVVNSYTLGTNVENLTFIGTGNFTGAGNAAANIIAGGSGNDSLTGGAGADTFVMNTGFGVDIITDFTAGAAGSHDVLDFASSIFASFAAMQAAATQVGANTVITAGANTLTLNGVTKANLVAADFITH